MRRLHSWVLIAVALLVVGATAAPASAKRYDVPQALGSSLSTVTAKSGIPVLVPDTLALDYGGQLFASGGAGARRYDLELAGAKNCGGANACFIAAITGQRGGSFAYRQRATLQGGVPARFKPLTCGGSCSPPEIQFILDGVLYEISAKVSASKNAGQKALLVAAANSAIAAGPR